jgi:outer membrane protein OmpA-like peptidoglycan-associated protein/osmotically-inducible protein OsmY
MWILVWLFGVAGIAWTGLNFAVPRFEQKLQIAIQQSISALSSGPLIISTKGRNVTLSGQVESEEEKQLLVAAVNSAPGVANVSSKLTIIDAAFNSASSVNDATFNVAVETHSPQPPILVAQSQSLPTDQAINPAVDPSEEEEFPLKLETTDTVASNVTGNAADSEKQAPSINIKVFGNILSIEGTMSTTDDTSSLIKNALDSFNLDVVSNGLTLNDSVGSAKWIDPLQSIMPLMGTMTNAYIGVSNQKLTLSGLAPTRKVHDAIINKALASIGNFSLIEKISVQGESADTNESTVILTTAADPDAVTKADEQARLAADTALKAKASEQAQLAATAAAAAKATEQARLDAEATALAMVQTEKRLAAEAAAFAKAAEQARIAAAATALAKAQTEERLAAEAAERTQLAAEAAAKARANAQARQAAITAAKVRAQERSRLAAEAAALAKAEEQARLAAEATATTQAKAEEQNRLAAEATAATQAKAEEQNRLAAEATAATQARVEEQNRLAAEATAAAQARAEEQNRLKAEVAAAPPAKLPQTLQSDRNVGLKQALQELPSLRILFGTEGNRLTIDSLDILDQIAATINQYPDTQVIIEGHTDATGELDRNLQLSLLRATTVRDYLIRQGVSVYNLRTIGVGEAVPLVSNDTPEGRAKNRRIEFTFR